MLQFNFPAKTLWKIRKLRESALQSMASNTAVDTEDATLRTEQSL